MRNNPRARRRLQLSATGGTVCFKVSIITGRRNILEDSEDLTFFQVRVNEPNLAFENVLKDLGSRRARRPQR